jgi:hypothetical protein
MSAAWVAASVRAQAMARRRLGTEAARALASSETFSEAVDTLARSPYGRHVRSGDTRPTAAHGVAATLLWNLRVLAGWLPASGAEMLRVLAGWFEIANVDEHVQALLGRSADPPFRLGSLTTAWPRLAAASSRDELRVQLAASAWGDPGGLSPREIQLGMRMAWAERVSARVLVARPWAAGAAALLLARERIARGRALPDRSASTAARMLGPESLAATSLVELFAALPPHARWTLQGVTDAASLWTAEVRWWQRLRTDGAALLRGSGFGPGRTIGAAAALAADAWLVRAALEIAGRGRGRQLEVFDAVA